MIRNYNTDDVIYSLATAWAKAAIAVIRVSGEGCIDRICPYFKAHRSLDSYPSNRAVYGDLASIDQCIITVFKGGHGYTGEEALEISCHGGLETVKAVLVFLEGLGMRQAQPGEFTLRAFLHGKMDLTQAEAVNELINSQGRTGAMLALDRLNGALFDSITRIKSIVTDILAVIEVQLDYAEDEIDQDLTFPVDLLEKAVSEISRISMTYRTGRLYSQGARVVLAGCTNAGKSSLFNFLLKEERAIVSSTAGTTRDFIESSCIIDGIPVRLFDTAGLRTSDDEIEMEGVQRAKSLFESADLILYLIDASDPVIDRALVDDERTICIVNKTDLVCDTSGFDDLDPVRLSIRTSDGFDELCRRISGKLRKDTVATDQSIAVIESTRQREDLERACASLALAHEHLDMGLPLDIITMDIQDALECLGRITGEVTTDDVLDRIFSTFCVGK